MWMLCSTPWPDISLSDRPDPPGSQVFPLHPEGPAGGEAHPAGEGPGARLRLLRPERQLRLHPDPAAGLLGACCHRGTGTCWAHWGGRGNHLCPEQHQGVQGQSCAFTAVASIPVPPRRRWQRSSSGQAPTHQPWARVTRGHQGLCVTRTPGRSDSWGQALQSPSCVWDMVGVLPEAISRLDTWNSLVQGAGGS